MRSTIHPLMTVTPSLGEKHASDLGRRGRRVTILKREKWGKNQNFGGIADEARWIQACARIDFNVCVRVRQATISGEGFDLETVTLVLLVELLVDAHELGVRAGFDVVPRGGVVLAVPNDVWTTCKSAQVPGVVWCHSCAIGRREERVSKGLR